MNTHFTLRAWPHVRLSGLVASALLLSAVHTPATAQILAFSRVSQPNAEVSLPTVETVPLKSLLKQWESDYHVTIFYESTLVGDKRVPLLPGVATLESHLNTVLPAANLGFKKLRADYYVVTENFRPLAVLPVVSEKSTVQNVTVAGRVTQASGEGLPGVTVLVKGTNIGTSTSADGSFSLSVPENSVLVFSSVGFVRQEVPVTGATTSLAIRMTDDTQALKEVVVVGYGTQKVQDVTGSVASVDTRTIRDLPVVSVDQKLAGQVAGVQVSNVTGTPGGGTSIKVRGSGSIGAGDQPLFVIE